MNSQREAALTVGGREMVFRMLVVWAILIFGMSGCTIKATTDTTTDGTTEFLSSTTGRSWWTNDGLVKHGEQARAFVALNHENLRQNMAQGYGKYVTALGHVLGIPHGKDPEFRTLLQLHYVDLMTSNTFVEDEALDQFLRQIQQVWAKQS